MATIIVCVDTNNASENALGFACSLIKKNNNLRVKLFILTIKFFNRSNFNQIEINNLTHIFTDKFKLLHYMLNIHEIEKEQQKSMVDIYREFMYTEYGTDSDDEDD